MGRSRFQRIAYKDSPTAIAQSKLMPPPTRYLRPTLAPYLSKFAFVTDHLVQCDLKTGLKGEQAFFLLPTRPDATFETRFGILLAALEKTRSPLDDQERENIQQFSFHLSGPFRLTELDSNEDVRRLWTHFAQIGAQTYDMSKSDSQIIFIKTLLDAYRQNEPGQRSLLAPYALYAQRFLLTIYQSGRIEQRAKFNIAADEKFETQLAEVDGQQRVFEAKMSERRSLLKRQRTVSRLILTRQAFKAKCYGPVRSLQEINQDIRRSVGPDWNNSNDASGTLGAKSDGQHMRKSNDWLPSKSKRSSH